MRVGCWGAGGWVRSHYVSVFVSWLCALLLVCPEVRVLVLRCPSPITAPDISSLFAGHNDLFPPIGWWHWKKECLIKCVTGHIHIPGGFISCILFGETPVESSKEGGMLKVIRWPLSFSHSCRQNRFFLNGWRLVLPIGTVSNVSSIDANFSVFTM